MQDPGLPVSAGWAGQRGALAGPALAGQGAELLAQLGGGGDQDRGQRGAGGLGRTGWRCPGRSSAAAAPRGPRRRASGRGAGRASSSRAARTASIGSLLPARRLPICRVLSISATCWPCAGQVPGQAQPVMAGALHRPDDLAGPGSRPDPGQQLGISRRGGRAPAAATGPGRGHRRSLRYGCPDGYPRPRPGPRHRHCSLVSSSGAMLEARHRPGGKLPRQSCDESRPKRPDKLLIRPIEGGQAGAGSAGDKSLERHATRRSGMQGVTRRHQAPTLAGPSHHGRYRHAKTHRHANGTTIFATAGRYLFLPVVCDGLRGWPWAA